MLASVIANSSPNKPKHVKYRPSDFMPRSPIAQTPEQQLKVLQLLDAKVNKLGAYINE